MTEQSMQDQPTVQATILHREYVQWGWRDLDPCLWRFFRDAGPWRPLLDNESTLVDAATGQTVIRGETHGDISYTFALLQGGEGERPFTFTGAIVLLPQATGTTQVQVLRFGASEHDAAVDAGLVALWQAARLWVAEQAAGQPAAQRGKVGIAMPRRAAAN